MVLITPYWGYLSTLLSAAMNRHLGRTSVAVKDIGSDQNLNPGLM